MLSFRSIASSSAGNMHLLSDGDTTIMLDCGISWKKARERIGFDRIGDIPVLVTHEHKDHCKGILDTQCRNDVYLPRETRDALNLLGYNHHAVEPLRRYTVGTMAFIPFPLVHDVACFGYLIRGKDNEKAAYITDTAYVPNRLPPLTLLAIECNYCEDILDRYEGSDRKRAERVARTHFGLENVLEFIRATDRSKLREIHLLHMSNGNSDEMKMIVSVEEAVPGVKVFAAQER